MASDEEWVVSSRYSSVENDPSDIHKYTLVFGKHKISKDPSVSQHLCEKW